MANKNMGQVRPATSLESLLVQLLRPSIEELQQRLSLLATDCSVEQIHLSRVLVRTVRACLDTFGSLLRKSPTMATRHELKWLDSILAPLRNDDVTLILLTQSLDNVTSVNHSTADQFTIRLINRLRDQREVHVTALHQQLENSRVHELVAGLLSLASDMPIRKRTLSLSTSEQLDAAIRCLETSRRKLLELAQHSLKKPSRECLHQVRIQAKRVRYLYTADQHHGLASDNATVMLAIQLHKLLGKHQDIAMLEAWLKKQQVTLVNEVSIKTQWLVQLKQERNALRNKYIRLVHSRSFA